VRIWFNKLSTPFQELDFTSNSGEEPVEMPVKMKASKFFEAESLLFWGLAE